VYPKPDSDPEKFNPFVSLTLALQDSHSIPSTPETTDGYSVEPFAKDIEELRCDIDRAVGCSDKRSYESFTRCLIPLARAVYIYRGKTYRVWADGEQLIPVLQDAPPVNYCYPFGGHYMNFRPFMYACGICVFCAIVQLLTDGEISAQPILAAAGPAMGLLHAFGTSVPIEKEPPNPVRQHVYDAVGRLHAIHLARGPRDGYNYDLKQREEVMKLLAGLKVKDFRPTAFGCMGFAYGVTSVFGFLAG
jgi:hypothetical protein